MNRADNDVVRSIGEILSALASLLVVLLALLACATRMSPVDAARWRASHEFDCAPEWIAVRERADLSPITYDVDACGRKARYSCQPAVYNGRAAGQMACVPEVVLPGTSSTPVE
jgi:hypothetical protein